MLAWNVEIGAVKKQVLTEVWLVIHKDIILSDKSHHFSLTAFYKVCRWCSNPHRYNLPWGSAHWFHFHLLWLISCVYSPFLNKVLKMFSFGCHVWVTHKKCAYWTWRVFCRNWWLCTLNAFCAGHVHCEVYYYAVFPLMCPTSKIFTVYIWQTSSLLFILSEKWKVLRI